MGQGIKVILFDLGNVLVDVDFTIAAKRISYFCEKSPKEIVGLVSGSNLNTLFEGNQITPEDFFVRLKDMLGLKISYKGFVPIWNEIFFLSAKNRSVYSLANNLRNNYRIAILSNINILHYDYIKEHFPIFPIFNQVFASCAMGLVKPDKRIYSRVLEELHVLPEEVFYTDDREELVKSASELNINSFVFTDFKKLKNDLINLACI
ncbi:MAG TPA: HAD family phosphatase [Candidatus Omnitrophota bacterium]|nr:HAD family phosphatase [Candidatus Omnitrophota bacterium]